MTDFALQQIVRSDIDTVARYNSGCAYMQPDKIGQVLGIISNKSRQALLIILHKIVTGFFFFFASLLGNSKPVNMELFIVGHTL